MEYRTLAVTLDDEEIKQKGDVLATRIEQLDDIEQRRKASADSFKEQIKEVHGDIGSLARQLRTRTEHRVIGCIWERDDGRYSMILVRQDTGEIVETRPMRDDERQTILGLGEAAGAPTGGAEASE